MRVLVLPSILASLCSLACAGISERTAGEGEGGPPVAAAAKAPATPSRSLHADEADAPGPRAREPEMPFDPRWADEVRAVVAIYESWGRVDDEARWAPWLCRIPRAATARISKSDDPGTHGHKLYTLYAMDPEAYGAPASQGLMAPGPAPDRSALSGLSQVIVKESFSPVPLDEMIDAKLGSMPNGGVGTHGLQPAERDGRRFVAGERQGLFIMMKPALEAGASAEGTDAGWVYATVEPDMITVTAVGVIESCADCHAEAGDGRLFGLPGPAGP